VPADEDPACYQSKPAPKSTDTSPALSMANQPFSAKTRQVAILVGEGFDGKSVKKIMDALQAAGAQGKLVATRVGKLTDSAGKAHTADFCIYNTDSVLWDAVYIAGGKGAEILGGHAATHGFLQNAYKHCKPLAASGTGVALLSKCCPLAEEDEPGVLASKEDDASALAPLFVEAVAAHRFWSREKKLKPT